MPSLLLALGVDSLLRDHPLAAVPALFAAGLLTSLSPCIFPMIPITAGILGGQGAVRRSRRDTLLYTLSYVTGLALVYALLGLIAGLTGSLFGAISSSPWAYFAMANVLLLAALALLDAIPVPLPPRLLAWAQRGGGGGSLPGVFVLGAASGLVAAPCGAPAFAAVLTFVAATGSGGLGFLYLFVFALGMTAILVVVGLSAGTLAALPRPGAWMVWIRRAAALLLLAMAEFYLVKMGLVL